MSVLAHLVVGQQNPEPAATRALGYLLRSGKKSGPLRAVIGLLGPAGVQFEPGRVECEEMHGDNQPDVSLYDADGRLRVLLENKFWAGLTDRQPVGYLDLLGGRRDAALVFVAPRERIDPLWRELGRRCAAADRAFEDEERTDDLVFARAGGTVLAAISWGQLLAALESAAEKKATRRDIKQLRGLTSRMEREGFLPFRGEELSTSSTAKLLLQCYHLIQGTLEKACGPTNIWGRTNGKRYGNYFRLSPMSKKLWFGVDLEAWRRCGVSPLWFALTGVSDKQAHIVDVLRKVDGEAHGFKDWVLIPVRLRTGEDEDIVVKDAARQVSRIGEALAAAFGEDTEGSKTDSPP